MAVLFQKTEIYEYCEMVIKLDGQHNRIFQVVLDNKTIRDLIVFLNTEKQLKEEHVNSFGQELFNRVTQRTTYAFSDPLGRVGQPYEVRRTGDYYKSFKVEVGRGFIIIESNPFEGEKNLVEMYGEDLEGLTEANLQILITKAYEFFIKWYRENILPK